MFKNPIFDTPFTSQTARDFFQNITGDSYWNDPSFLGTMRALLAPRMKPDDRISLRFSATNLSASRLQSLIDNYGSTGPVTEVMYVDEDCVGEFYVHNFSSSNADENTAWLDYMRNHFCETYNHENSSAKGWVILDKVTALYRKVFDVICFVNPELKTTVIFTGAMNLQKYHYLQASILGCVPWYFDPAKGITDLEKELIESLREKTSTHYEEVMAKLASQYDFKTAKIKNLLKGFEARSTMQAITQVQNDITTVIHNIESYNTQIGTWLRTKFDLEVKLLGLQDKVASQSEESDIMDYFLTNQHLVLESVNQNTMVFGVKDVLTYFDEDMARRFIDNNRSYMYYLNGRYMNDFIPAEDIRRLMTAIFIDQTLKLHFCAAYEFKLPGNVRARGGYMYSTEYNGCMPNPHIDKFSCLGNYQPQINTLLQKNDYIGAIEQCIASCKSLNLGDAPVMNRFMSVIYSTTPDAHRKCIELPDGDIVDPQGAISYLKAQEVTANGENH